MSIERRVFPVEGLEFREEGDKMTFRGYAAVFNQLSEPIGGLFREKISPGAFTRTIKQGDVRMLINHDPNLILARSKAGVGTLRLAEDSTGLHVEAEMAPTTYARDLSISMQEGNIDQMSFGFQKVKDQWDRSTEMPTRDLKETRLFDVSPVTFPAYPQTTAQVRNELRAILASAGIEVPPVDFSDIDLDLAVAFLASDEARVGKAISAANADKIRAAIEVLESLVGTAEEQNSQRADGGELQPGELCPICGAALLANEDDAAYCPVDGLASEMNSLQIEREQRERRLALLKHLTAA